MNSQPAVTWRSHYALGMLALIYIFNYIDRLLVSILVEPIKLEFGVSDTMIGMLSGVAFAIFYTAFGLPLGRLSDRIGRKPVIAAACVAWSIMTMLCGIATSFTMLLLFRIGVAIGEAGGSAPSLAMVSQLYPARLRSRALAVFLMGPAIGSVVGLGLGGWIAEMYGWRWAFIIIGAPGVALGVILALTVTETKIPDSPSANNTPSPAEKFIETFKQLLRTPAYGWIVGAASIATASGFAVGTWTPSFLMRTHALSIQEAGLLMGVAGGLTSAVGTIFCGVVTDRLVRRNAGWQLRTALIGIAICIPFGMLFYLWPSSTAFYLGSMAIPTAFFFYLGFAFFATWWTVPLFGSLSYLFPTRQLAQATALLFMGTTLLGVGLGPLLVGMMSDFFNASMGNRGLGYALAICIGLLSLTCLCLFIAIPRYRKQLENNPIQNYAATPEM